MMRIGFICSSGGAAFSSAFHILENCGYELKVSVVTDRACGVESVCADINVEFLRIEEADRDFFSKKAAQWLCEKQGVDWIALFFSRLIGKALFSRLPCVNFHPGLLPAFPGIGAVRGMHKSGAKFFGATAHLTDHTMDGGPILAQVVAPVPFGTSLEDLNRISFAQKIYLLLVICESAENGQWEGVELSATNRKMLYVPQGFAHGFISLTDDAEILYMVSAFYSPEHEKTVRWNDPSIKIDWPMMPGVISEKDQLAPDFSLR